MKKIAEGKTAEIFDHSPTEVLKLYYTPFSFIRDIEYDKMSKLHAEWLPKLFQKVELNKSMEFI